MVKTAGFAGFVLLLIATPTYAKLRVVDKQFKGPFWGFWGFA